MSRRLISIKVLPVLMLLLIPGAAMALNVEIRDTSTNQVVNGTTVNLGDVQNGYIIQRVFAVTNREAYSITMTSCQIVQDQFSNAYRISVCPIPAGSSSATFYPGMSSNLAIQLVAAPGTYTGTVYANFLGGSITFNVTGRVLESSPSIRVETAAGSVISKGSTFNFGSTQTNTALEQTFRIRNLGAQALNVNVTVTGTGYVLAIPPPSSIGAGGEATFRVRLYSLTAGTFTGSVSITNNDPNDNPFNFSLSGSVTAAPAPRIRIVDNSSGGLLVNKYSVVNYGSTVLNNPVDHVFMIHNDGNATLSITNPTMIVSGTGFSLASSPPSSIAAGGSGSFTVRFLSATAGTFNGSISINNNDPNNNPFPFSVTATASTQQVPRIRVTDDGGTTLPHGSIYHFGTVLASQWVERTFRIWNDGNATLSLGGISGGGTGFSVIQSPPSSISPGASGTFRISFTSAVAGDFSGQYSFSTNDPSRSYYTLNVTASVPGPRMRVVAAGSMPVVNGGVYVYPNTPAGVSQGILFTIYNDGNQTLTISNFNLSAAGGFYLLADPPVPSSIAPGGSGSFRIRLLSNIPGQYTATVSFNNNDASKDPFSFQLRGTVVSSGPAPEIRVVSGDGVTLSNGGLYTSFPSTTPGAPVSRAFTIYNDGDATLTISNPSSLVSGAGFSLIVVPPASIAAGSSGVFRVRLMSSSPGTYTGTVSIQSNDPDENPFTFQIRGTVTN